MALQSYISPACTLACEERGEKYFFFFFLYALHRNVRPTTHCCACQLQPKYTGNVEDMWPQRSRMRLSESICLISSEFMDLVEV